MKLFCRHHYHNLGPIEFARCGGVSRYEWQCCNCGKRGRTAYLTFGPEAFFSHTSVSPFEESPRAAFLGRR